VASGTIRMVNDICDAGYQPARERTIVAYISQFVDILPLCSDKMAAIVSCELAISLIVALGAKLTCITQCRCT
jgi:hypothetical protein